MNLIIIKDSEIYDDGLATLTDRRAKHVIEVLKPGIGQSLRVGLLNGKLGTGTVQAIKKESITLKCTLTEEPENEPNIDLILALPRPKTMKRLWAELAALGIRRLFLTNANKVERDYFGTHWLKDKNYEPLLVEGLEQAGDTRLPEVTIVHQIKPFVQNDVESLFPDHKRIIAHPSLESTTLSPMNKTENIVLSVGPEGGWNGFEIDLFENHGFTKISLGKRILRTDTACTSLISILREKCIK